MPVLTLAFEPNGTPKRASVAYLAGAFADCLHEALTADQWEEMRQLNAAETHPDVCHSHDFLDANDVMDTAWRRAWGQAAHLPCDVEEGDDKAGEELERQQALWNAAWSLAKAGWLTA